MKEENVTIDETKIEEKVKPIEPSFDKDKLGKDVMEYYRNFFDVNDILRVISIDTFPTREFGFERLDTGFTRNKSFVEPSHVREYLSTFPVGGAYIGSLYQDRLLPSDKNNKAVTIHNTPWVGRELIFDFDMDEYDLIRTCECTGRKVCIDCWMLMQKASEIIDDTLREDFGYKKLEWVYTGGRGYHCWVLDKKAFDLDQDQRAAIIGHMQLIHDPKGLQKIDKLGNNAELLRTRIYEKLGREFILNEKEDKTLKDLGFGKKKLETIREFLQTTTLYRDIVDSVPKGKNEEFLETIIKNLYPRIDHKVTIDVRRLIRMPGSVHIRTQNISEYISDPANFNPITDAKNIYQFINS
ncbi:MAG: DNA primase small subunit PriS [Candidatus Heimdallarchaeota archaeon LC_2]|nr:MAG: DNA primase small subunit PriS [Candidatus Heimdallarchaeota archaeon LC_2]